MAQPDGNGTSVDSILTMTISVYEEYVYLEDTISRLDSMPVLNYILTKALVQLDDNVHSEDIFYADVRLSSQSTTAEYLSQSFNLHAESSVPMQGNLALFQDETRLVFSLGRNLPNDPKRCVIAFLNAERREITTLSFP